MHKSVLSRLLDIALGTIAVALFLFVLAIVSLPAIVYILWTIRPLNRKMF
jgi:hypothetical protein